MSDNWPKHADGSNKSIGQMTPEERRAVFSAAGKRLQAEMEDPNSGLHRAIVDAFAADQEPAPEAPPEGVIPHCYVNASDNVAQFEADRLPSPRQEVTVDFYLEHMVDLDRPLWRWTADEDHHIGLDPWRFHMDLPMDPEDIKERGWRIFVQKDHLPPEIAAKLLTPWPSPEEMVEAEAEEAAHWNHAAKTAPGI
jgi:hypothetical protein